MSLQYAEPAPWMASPVNSDHNYYGSPMVSPGSWNVASPASVMGCQTSQYKQNSQPMHTPSTVCSADYSHSTATPVASPPSSYTYSRNSYPSSASTTITTTHDFIGLPQNLGRPVEPQPELEKTRFYVEREQAALKQAQRLMEETYDMISRNVDLKTPKTNHGQFPEMDDNGFAKRQEKILAYKEKKRVEQIRQLEEEQKKCGDDNGDAARKAALLRYKLKKSQEARGIKPNAEYSPLRFEPPKERLATSTRKKKAVTAEEDYESINDFKCQFDIDREKDTDRKSVV